MDGPAWNATLDTARRDLWPAWYWVQVAGTEVTFYNTAHQLARTDLLRIGVALLAFAGCDVGNVAANNIVGYRGWRLSRPMRRGAVLRPATDVEALACLVAAGRVRTEAV